MSEEIKSEAEQSNKETAVATKKQNAVAEKTNWARLHGSWRERIERMLPDAKMIDQFMYCAETQYGKNKEAFERCTPVSLLNCLMTSAKYGILPDGRNGYLIPYGNECQLQFDYKGLVHVVIRDGVAKKVYAETVCANDKFLWENGEVKRHEISLPRGQILGAYCAVTLCNGEKQYELMDIDEINTVKSCSRGSSSPSSPWNKFFSEMAKKTVFRRVTKWLKLSPDVMDAIAADNEGFDFNQPNVPISARGGANALFKMPETVAEIEMSKRNEQAIEVQTVGEKQSARAESQKKGNLPF